MSMTQVNHSAENALAERVNGILKQEYELDADFQTPLAAKQAIVQGIRLYNYHRPHTALGYSTPGSVHDGEKHLTAPRAKASGA
jgi:putative transposase